MMLAGFVRIANPCRALVVIEGAASPAFGDVSLHETTLVDGVSRMRPVPALRIAPGASVEVALRYAPDALIVRVSDDGPGSGAEPGLGLTGMRERVHMVGGELTIDPSGGFVVEARLPA